MKAAPVNPSDINIIQGSYGTKLRPPATAGTEGVGIVEKVGKGVDNLKENDRVIITTEGVGTWASHVLTSSKNLLKVSDKIPLEYAACLSINPTTAYRLLADFENLQEGFSTFISFFSINSSIFLLKKKEIQSSKTQQTLWLDFV